MKNLPHAGFQDYQESFLVKAYNIANAAHAGQFRKDGVTPYIEHPHRIVMRLAAEPGVTDEVLAVAWAHDVPEDTTVTLADLWRAGMPVAVIDAVDALTKRKGESYATYLERVAANPIAKKVKIADIHDNLSDDPSPRAKAKYHLALGRLLSE